MSDASDPKAMVADVFSASAATYDQVIEFFGPFGRALVAGADLRRGAKVLDVASGRGACLYPAVEAVGPEGSVVGIDLAAGMVDALGAELADKGVANASVELGDAESLRFADQTFDAVLAGFMIFFAPDPDRVLAEFARVLRPGGTVALTTFDGETPSKILRDVGEELFGPQDTRPSEAFDRAEVLDAALAHAGFVDIEGVHVIERFGFGSAEQLEQWHRSHFGRLLLDALDPDQLALYRRRLDEHVRTLAVGDGYELVQQARVTVARKR